MASFIHSNRPRSFPSIYSYDPTAIPSPLPSPQFYLDQSALHTFFAGPVGMLSSKSSRMRRKSSSTLDQVKKHRRTRSGCLTCRHRRVKCDEAHPTCERCAKGGRECSYPDPPASKSSSVSSSSKGKKERRDTPTSASNSVKDVNSSPESNLYDDDETYIDTDDAAEYSMASSPVDTQFLRPSGTFPSYARRASSKSASPFLGPGSSRNNTFPTRAIEETQSEVGSPIEVAFKTDDNVNLHLPRVNSTNSNPVFRLSLVEGQITPDMNFFLSYHQQAITCEHYMLKTDSSSFFKTRFIQYATNNDALLHAVVAFSAFHYHINHPSNQYEDFLEYYNKALELLRLSFVSGTKPGLATLMTILQLAILEEYLGDWSNLIQHRKGAHQLLISLYSAETISETAEGAMIFSWFTRLDNFVASMCGQEVILDKEWYEINRSFCQAQNSISPSARTIIAQAESEARFMTMEVANLLFRRDKGIISSETFLSYGAAIQENISQFWNQLHPKLASIHRDVNQFEVSMESSAYAQNPRFYQGDEDYLRPALYIFADVHALGLLLMHHTSLAHGIHHEYMMHHALSVCKIYTAIETYINQAPHLLFPLFAPLCMATIWMPDTQHGFWFRSKLFKLENLGLLLPIAFRAHLSTLWDEPDLRFSWLPHAQAVSSTTSLDGGIIMSIKNLAEIRDSESPVDQTSLDIRRINNLFGYVDIDGPTQSVQGSYLSFPEFNNSGLFTTTYNVSNTDLNQYYQ